MTCTTGVNDKVGVGGVVDAERHMMFDIEHVGAMMEILP